ncbi:MAG: SDR family NAD(P)-dependent oxidoreductase [Nitrospiraceae bacterium]|nr:MAG: SDR family NAD(P)-dependent oxidoreductase [Nitrospiraceae bacterium]
MVCLITGSSRGLGSAIAVAFGKKGYRVVVHYKERKEEALQVASLIKESLLLGADVRNSGEVTALVNEVIKRWGRIDVLVNNAGMTKESLLLKTSEKDFDEMLEINVKGSFNFMRAASRYMTEQKNGHIINISSIAGLKGKAGLSAYAASKAGLLGLTFSAARELSEYNIMVNAVLPGYMLTDMGINSSDGAKEKALNESLLKKFASPDAVAEFICCLAETTGVTGQIFNLDSRVL